VALIHRSILPTTEPSLCVSVPVFPVPVPRVMRLVPVTMFPLFMIRSEETTTLPASIRSLPDFVIVRSLNISPVAFVMFWSLLPVKVTFPVPSVKAPVLVQSPYMVRFLLLVLRVDEMLRSPKSIRSEGMVLMAVPPISI